jgi:hypothetical protein
VEHSTLGRVGINLDKGVTMCRFLDELDAGLETGKVDVGVLLPDGEIVRLMSLKLLTNRSRN